MNKYLYAIKSLIIFYAIKLFYTKQFEFTKANLIYPLCNFEFSRQCKVKFGYKISMRRNTQVTVRDCGELAIGDNGFFNANCIITCHSKIQIGNDCKFGPGCMMFDQDHNMKDTSTIVEKGNFTKDSIIIGDGCWFGAGCIILKGTEIGNHCVFGAGCIIKGKYSDNSIIVQKRQNTIREFEC